MLRPLTVARAALGFLAKRVLLWIERSQQRAALGELDNERLHDLGLCREDVARECAKWFWQ
jgi:uncharacterized protein YjiS (DUF1127 family)